MCGVVGLRNASFDFSADCLEHSLQQSPDDLEITDTNIIEKIKENNEFKEKVSSIVEQYSETDFFDTKDNSESFSFNNGDLFYALHNVYIDVSGKKQLDNSWYLEIVLSDTYDFTELKKIEDYINNEDFIKSFGNSFINNFALIATSCKVLNPYNITIKFTIDNWK